MEALDYWRLCDELTIHQAALLIAGVDPASYVDIEKTASYDRPTGFDAAKHAIINALRREDIKGEAIPCEDYGTSGNPQGPLSESIDPAVSRVDVEALRAWLRRRGLRSGFFFPEGSDAPDYLDKSHPRYAPKLAAAVQAWQATGSDAAISGRSPKKALEKWLREHAAELGMSDEDGKFNETGIEEVAKVANWQPGGGAPKTPGD